MILQEYNIDFIKTSEFTNTLYSGINLTILTYDAYAIPIKQNATTV